MSLSSPGRDGIYRESVTLPFSAIVSVLNENAGPTVVQTMAGVVDRGAPAFWATESDSQPDPEVVSRLRLGYRVWRTVQAVEGEDTALAWLMGANPRLGEELPLLLIQQGRAQAVLGAAEAFVDDTGGN